MVKRATVTADGKVRRPKLTTQEKLTASLRWASHCQEMLQQAHLLPTTRQLFEDSRDQHLRDAKRLQSRLKKEAANG